MTLSSPYREKELRRLALKLGLPADAPIRWDLLDMALTHPTASATANYERLEFVGDAVVKLAAAEFLYAAYPTVPEGELSAMRSVLVSDRMLAQIGDRYGLERYLLMGPSAAADRVGHDTRIAAAMEAMLAALYLSGRSLNLIHPWLDSHLQEFATIIASDPARLNYKGALQGITQTHMGVLPEYRLTELSQRYGHPERFVAEVFIHGQSYGQGKGQSKKAAQQAAARIAFDRLQEQLSPADSTFQVSLSQIEAATPPERSPDLPAHG
ncbi:ribonuclease III [Leptolyngbya sp. AN02str]|uniref:ribonuclease III n=1 Tax=Leptolyngbya sp. AN02str TaxID=3423363 RepID=UPI003D3170AD